MCITYIIAHFILDVGVCPKSKPKPVLEIFQPQSPDASLENVVTQVQRLQNQIANLHEYIYAARRQFSKLDANGRILPDMATDWVAVQDHSTQLIWEYKPLKDEVRDCSRVFTWNDPAIATYKDTIQDIKLAGFTDWRLPSIAELRTVLRYPGPDQRLFGPLTNPEQPLPIVFSKEQLEMPVTDDKAATDNTEQETAADNTEQETAADNTQTTEDTNAPQVTTLGWAVARESGLQVATIKAHLWLVRGGKL